jgi:drug/metabolite transporter (DMT)-like permease
MQGERRAVVLLLLGVILWSTSGLLIKESSLGALALVGGRSALAALVLAAYVRKPHWTWSLPQVGGALALATTYNLFVVATQLTSAASAILLQYTAPLWVALFGIWYLRERPHTVDYVSMGLIAVGMLLFFGDKLTGSALLGNLLAALSGITMAWMTLFLRKQKDGSPYETVLLGNVLAAAIGLPFLLTASPSAVDWGILLFLGIFQLGAASILHAYAIKRLAALEVILICTLEPILNPLWVFLFNGETPGPLALVGGAIVVAAVLLRGLAMSLNFRRSGRKAHAAGD